MIRRAAFCLILCGFLITVSAPIALAAGSGGGDGSLKEFGLALGAGVGLALAAFGGALGQGRTASAALEGIARNPSAADRMFVPMIIGLALIESLVLYTFVIAIMLSGKI